MTLTAPTTQLPTDAELLAIFKTLTPAQKWVISHGHDSYVNRRLCFWLKSPATAADAQTLMDAGYVQLVAKGQYRLTDLGLALYRAWLHQPPATPNKTPGYNGTHMSRNRNLRDHWETKLSSTPLANAARAADAQPEAVEIPTAEIETEPASDKVVEILHAPVPPTPPQPPTPAVPGVIQLDLTAFIQPLIAEIETLKAQLAAQSKPAPRPVARRPRPSMPARRGGAA